MVNVKAAALVLAATLTAVFGPAGRGAAVDARSGSSLNRTDQHAIEAFVGEQTRRNGIPGLALAVADRSGTVMSRGFGTADSGGHAVTAHTPFVLASVSKPLTATAVMQLVDAGRVRLDAPVQRYLPEFRVADAQASRAITVQDLLTHTSGLPAAGCERDADTLQEFVSQLHTVTLDAPVGSTYIYCSGNYNVLGRLVERVSGQSFADYMRDHVFRPLHMTHSYASEAPALADGLAQGHRWIFGEVTPMSYYNPSGVPSGYLVSTAADMAHFLTASLNGGRYGRTRVLSARSVRIMQRSWVDTGDGGSYGLGWHQGLLGGVSAVYHYGENYNTETLAFLEPATGRGAVILINAQGLLAVPALRSVEAGVARMLAGEDPGKPSVSVGTAYVVFDTVVLVTVIAALVPLLRLRRWRRSLQRGVRRRTVARMAAELTLPVLVLIATQVFLGMVGATWREMFRLVPDVMSWLTGLCVLVLLGGVAHALVALQQTRHRRALG